MCFCMFNLFFFSSWISYALVCRGCVQLLWARESSTYKIYISLISIFSSIVWFVWDAGSRDRTVDGLQDRGPHTPATRGRAPRPGPPLKGSSVPV